MGGILWLLLGLPPAVFLGLPWSLAVVALGIYLDSALGAAYAAHPGANHLPPEFYRWKYYQNYVSHALLLASLVINAFALYAFDAFIRRFQK